MAILGSIGGDLSFSASTSLSTPKVTVPTLPSVPPGGPALTMPGAPRVISSNITLQPAISRQFMVTTLAAGSVIPKNVTLAKATPVDFAKPSYALDSGVGLSPEEFYGPMPVGMTEAQAEAAGRRPSMAMIAAGLGVLVVGALVVAKKRKRR